MNRKEQKKLEKLKKRKKRKSRRRMLVLVSVLFLCVYSDTNVNISNIVIIENNIEETVETISEVSKNESDIVLPSVSENDNETVNIQAIEIEEIVQKYIKNKNLDENNFAFFYYEPETQKKYIYNGDTYFTAASTIKVPLAMIYYDKINNGDLNDNSTFQYMKDNFEEGAGTTAFFYKVGDNVPLPYLLEQMIVNSDNTATNILKTGLGGEKAYRILIKQYTKQNLPVDFNENNITSANYALDVLTKIYENQEKYKDLIELMKKSSGGEYLKKNITTFDVAHKYGSFEGFIHDYGICFTKQEYLIGVFTKKVAGAENLIADINKEIAEIKK